MTHVAKLCYRRSAEIGKTRVKGGAGFLPQKDACYKPVQQRANQQAHAAPVKQAGIVVGHTNGWEQTRCRTEVTVKLDPNGNRFNVLCNFDFRFVGTD